MPEESTVGSSGRCSVSSMMGVGTFVGDSFLDSRVGEEDGALSRPKERPAGTGNGNGNEGAFIFPRLWLLPLRGTT